MIRLSLTNQEIPPTPLLPPKLQQLRSLDGGTGGQCRVWGRGHEQVRVLDTPLTSVHRTVPRTTRGKSGIRQEGAAVAQAWNDDL